jgi:hypothetical protein
MRSIVRQLASGQAARRKPVAGQRGGFLPSLLCPSTRPHYRSYNLRSLAAWGCGVRTALSMSNPGPVIPGFWVRLNVSVVFPPNTCLTSLLIGLARYAKKKTGHRRTSHMVPMVPSWTLAGRTCSCTLLSYTLAGGDEVCGIVQATDLLMDARIYSPHDPCNYSSVYNRYSVNSVTSTGHG